MVKYNLESSQNDRINFDQMVYNYLTEIKFSSTPQTALSHFDLDLTEENFVDDVEEARARILDVTVKFIKEEADKVWYWDNGQSSNVILDEEEAKTEAGENGECRLATFEDLCNDLGCGGEPWENGFVLEVEEGYVSYNSELYETYGGYELILEKESSFC